MTSTKTRHEFLLESDLSAQLNALAQDPSTTKTDIIVQAIKVFLERGTESEFAQLTAKRFDTLARDLDGVRSDLETALHEFERVRSDVTIILESLTLFIRFSIMLNAKVPQPDADTQAIGQERFLKFADQVGRRVARLKASSRSKDETGKA